MPDPSPSPPAATPASSLGLDDLIALNDELAALVRAGIPLEQTLGDLGRDFPGRLGRATVELAGRVEHGASLPAAFAAMPDAFPSVYRAAIAAGLRTGHLPDVLEDLASSARRQRDLWQTITQAALYPLFLVLLTYALFVLLIVAGLPRFAGMFERDVPRLVQVLLRLGEDAPVWGVFPPLLLVLGSMYAWQRSLRVGASGCDRLPVLGPMLRDARRASFCENLALLLRHQVALHEALPLGADSVLDRNLVPAARSLAAQLSAGSRLDPQASLKYRGFPSLLLWLIASGQPQASLVAALQRTAAAYRRQSLRSSDWLRYYLPVLLTLVVGGTAALLFALSLFVPMVDLLLQIAHHGMAVR